MFNRGQDNKQEELIELGRNILRESDLEIPIQYNGEQFTLKYPNPATSAMIEAEIARRIGGYPRASFSAEHLAGIEAYVTIDILMIPEKCPKWFKGPWTCYDDELITTLIKGYFTFRTQFQDKMRGGGFEKGSQGTSS